MARRPARTTKPRTTFCVKALPSGRHNTRGLQEESGLPKYGGSQVRTCFDAAKWTINGDFTQPMRTMKRDKHYFDKDAPKNEWKLNAHGLDEARKIKYQAGA